MADKLNTRVAGPNAVVLFRQAIAASTGLDFDDPYVIRLAHGYDGGAGTMIEALRLGFCNVNWYVEKGNVLELAPSGRTVRLRPPPRG